MATVQTVLGPVNTDDLGPTLVHEHVRISYPGEQLDPAYSADRTGCVDTAVERMAGLAEHGVRTFVDPCPIDLGRDPDLLADVARQSGMQIVCSTGFYLQHIGIPYYWRARSAEDVAEFYLHEINKGIGETGITVISHCENSNGGDVQQDILAEHGADLSRALIGHQGQSTDMDYIRGIADGGHLSATTVAASRSWRPTTSEPTRSWRWCFASPLWRCGLHTTLA